METPMLLAAWAPGGVPRAGDETSLGADELLLDELDPPCAQAVIAASNARLTAARNRTNVSSPYRSKMPSGWVGQRANFGLRCPQCATLNCAFCGELGLIRRFRRPKSPAGPK